MQDFILWHTRGHVVHYGRNKDTSAADTSPAVTNRWIHADSLSPVLHALFLPLWPAASQWPCSGPVAVQKSRFVHFAEGSSFKYDGLSVPFFFAIPISVG
jgi:hypothetical protein